MGSHMKTTIEIAEPLLLEAKRVAADENITLRALIEAGLRRILDERKHREPFRLRDMSFGHGGSGLQPPFCDDDWRAIREAAYEERS